MIQTTFVNGQNPFISQDVSRQPKPILSNSEAAKRNRAAVLAYIRSNPGCFPAEIRTGANVSKATGQKYRLVLLAEGLITQSEVFYDRHGRQRGCQSWAVQ